MAHLNMRCLLTGYDEMSSLLVDYRFDVFGVSETWLKPCIPSDRFQVPGYTLFRADRKATMRYPQQTGGGVALYVREDIPCELYELANVEPGVESIAAVIKAKGMKVGVAIAYRPPM